MNHKLTLAAALLFMVVTCYSQAKKDNKIRFKSISGGLGICAGEINTGGLSAYIDVTTAINKNLLSL